MGVLFALMAAIALVEVLVPLARRDRSGRPHAAPNLALTALTFATNAFLGAAMLITLAWLQVRDLGLLNWSAIEAPWAIAIGVLVLDFATYLCHVTLHKVPALWRFHRVHHCDFAVDVTTSFRQHPGESLFRFLFLFVTATVLGVSPVGFVLYRTLSALTALLEHANVRAPVWLDDVLSLIVTWPTFHKVHHSRAPAETDTNYSNIFSIWDRLFLTATPARRGRAVVYGLDGFDDSRDQSIGGLLSMPFRVERPESAIGVDAG
jgi:sterol desaturase/sphingolipid hydroxylase (fatty acid hydroxylase superfamily)